MPSILDFLQPPQPEPLINPEFAREEQPFPGEPVESAAPPPAPSRSLTELQAQLRPAPKPEPRGDDLIATANATNTGTEEQKYAVKRFAQGQEMIQARLDSDEAWAEKYGPELQKLAETGDETYINRVLDLADDLKIEALKQSNPEIFSPAKAGLLSLTNTATLGQLSRLTGLAQMSAGKDYDQSVEDAAERIRLLQREYPKASFAGAAAAFLTPGSPAKILFSKIAGLTGKATAAVLGPVAKNPTMLQAILRTGAASGAAGAADGAFRGLVGQDLDSLSLDRSVDQGILGGMVGGGMGALSPVAGAVANKTIVPLAEKVGEFGSRVAEGLSGMSAEALRASKTRGAQIGAAAGTEREIAIGLRNRISEDAAAHIESKAARAALEKVAVEVDITPLLGRMRKAPEISRPDQAAAGTFPKMAEWADFAEAKLAKMGYAPNKAPLSAVRQLVDEFQSGLDELGAYNQSTPKEFLAQLKGYGAQLRKVVLDGASSTAGGAEGKTYVELMKKAATKASFAEKLVKRMGKDEETGARFIQNLFGKNNEVAKLRLQKLDEMYGTNFYERAKDAYFARQIGGPNSPGAKLSMLPMQTTGRSMLGAAAGGAGYLASDMIGEFAPDMGRAGKVLSAAAVAASSPRAARAMLGASDNITGLVRQVFANPSALERMATGRGVSKDVQMIAKEVVGTLKKDGPISAASTLRAVADTPFFLPFVHYYEIQSRKNDRKAVTGRNY